MIKMLKKPAVKKERERILLPVHHGGIFSKRGKNVITNTVRIKKDVIWGRKINKKGAPKKLDQ
mgnify:CR=1 FL=1